MDRTPIWPKALRFKPIIWGLWTALLCLAFGLSGCNSPGPFRSDETQIRAGYSINYVEFDDQGWFYNLRQESEAEKTLEQAMFLDGHAHDTLVVVFVHGWENDARSNDPHNNAARFETVLQALAAAEKTGKNRHIVGVFVGWPGKTISNFPLTFYTRKNAGDRVGYAGGVTLLLLRLNAIYQRAQKAGSRQSFFVTIGHSFGAQVLYDSVSNALVEHVVNAGLRESDILKDLPLTFYPNPAFPKSPPPKAGAEFTGIGNLVIFINPAFEANRIFNLKLLLQTIPEETYASEQRPVLAIFSSEGDRATELAFPVGRKFSTLLHRYRADTLGELQRYGDVHTLGWDPHYLTHELTINCHHLPSNVKDPWSSSKRKNQFITDSMVLTYVSPANWTPLYVVSVKKKIIRDHTDIWGVDFETFLADFVGSLSY